MFDPLNLDISNTPTAVKQKLANKEYSTGILESLFQLKVYNYHDFK